MKVLSLCDGMSCGRLALERCGFTVEEYYASEIKDIAIKVTLDNYPDTVEIGDVRYVSYKDGKLHTEKGIFNVGKIDLVMFGSPCQTFSVAIPTEHRIGFENKDKSGLFFECYRILQEVKPKYFLVENVRSMKDADRDIISGYLGVQPIMIDSALVAPAMRKRYYWTNIPDVTLPEKKDVPLQSILTSGYTERSKARCLAVIDSRPNTTPIKMFHRYYSSGFTTVIFKDRKHYLDCCNYYNTHYKGMAAVDIPVGETDVFDGVRYFNKVEMERCQTVPEGYTKCLTRNEAADVLGDGWTIDVISHILSFIPDGKD